MSFYSKYVKYKSKYLALSNQIGGNESDIFLIYIASSGKNVDPREYICSFLWNNYLYYKRMGISDKRIHCIFGSEMPIDNTPFACTGKIHGGKEVKQFMNSTLPYGVSITYVNNETNIVFEIKNILAKYCNQKTTIILVYDGDGDNSGNLPIYTNKYITPDDIYNIFANYKENNKLFIWSPPGYNKFEDYLTKKKIKHISILSNDIAPKSGAITTTTTSTLSRITYYLYSAFDKNKTFEILQASPKSSNQGFAVKAHPQSLINVDIRTFFRIYIDDINIVLNQDIIITNGYDRYITYSKNKYRKPDSILLSSVHNLTYVWKIIKVDKNTYRIQTKEEVCCDLKEKPVYAYLSLFETKDGSGKVSLYNISETYPQNTIWLFEYEQDGGYYYIYVINNKKKYYLVCNEKFDIHLSTNKPSPASNKFSQ
jgi:hypothetical protein